MPGDDFGGFERFLRVGEGRRLKRLRSQAEYIGTLEPELEQLSDEELKGKTAEFRQRVANGEAWVLGDPIEALVVLEDGDGHLLVDNVAVRPDLQGRGLGRALLDFAEETARGRGYRELRLYTNERMTENRALYAHLGWTELARVVRGRFLAMREEDFVVSARLVGCTQLRTIFVHMVPSFMSHIIASITLAIPAMILAETALSFLGLGIKAPTASWGSLLSTAPDYYLTQPWLMVWPGVAVLLATLAFNLLGDGLRDALDPTQRRMRA